MMTPNKLQDKIEDGGETRNTWHDLKIHTQTLEALNIRQLG